MVSHWRMSFKWGDEDLWEACRNRGIAATGYYDYSGGTPAPRVGDCSELTEAEFDAAVSGWTNRSGKYALRAIAFAMEPGDVIYARSDSHIVGRGTVRSDAKDPRAYRWQTGLLADTGTGCLWEHYVKVDWEEYAEPLKVTIQPIRYTVWKLEGDRLQMMLDAEAGIETIPMSHDRAAARELPEDEAIAEAAEIGRSRRQGFQSNPEFRRLIEDHAMESAIEHFEGDGYVVENVSGSKSYDLRCTKRGRVLHVEVKGTQTDGQEVLLTPNEVKFARAHRDSMVLFVVTGVEVWKESDATICGGGDPWLIQPWDIGHGKLTPTGYRYRHPWDE